MSIKLDTATTMMAASAETGKSYKKGDYRDAVVNPLITAEETALNDWNTSSDALRD